MDNYDLVKFHAQKSSTLVEFRKEDFHQFSSKCHVK